jgi:putative ABC transport system permease protein
MPMEQAESLLRPAGPSQVSIRLDSRWEADIVAASMGSEWTARTYRDESEDLLAINRIRRKALSIMVLVVMGIAATGIANTVIMSVFERIREVGTLAAMGMSGPRIFALFLIEGGLMGLMAASAGAALGSFLNLRLSTQGIDVSGLPDAGSQVGMTTTLYTAFSWSMVAAALAFGVVVATLASAWPARYAARLKPADAVREQA